ncbi:hypothetical protein IFT84_18815 [Rhizobium sp. CFBP 8762]|uniref:hypothetical protein n=1 Tax=Rhizobium sp. CFBP 8762 TaxID=2775279 RepID=UPI0017867194|nr:hypothetical protein [Rhizobium sp. CFBP 8762]MBD8556565.1 hypothetical protein [Rhizobium sp. CFBP 8762]
MSNEQTDFVSPNHATPLTPDTVEQLWCRARMLDENPHVLEFPVWKVRKVAEKPAVGLAPCFQNNILPFKPRPYRRKR